MDADGNPLANNIMGADIRGEELETPPLEHCPRTWTFSCGHLRERMDPVFRLLWWRKYHRNYWKKQAPIPTGMDG